MKKIIGDKGTIWFYDALNNKVYDANKVPLNLMHAPKAGNNIFYKHRRLAYFNATLGTSNPVVPSDKTYIYSNKITDLTIQLGMKCNYKCLYCFQKDLPPDSLSKIDLESFLQRLKNSEISWSDLKVVQLWGGEPLVYWKHFKKIVEFIRKEIPEFKGYFHFTTNGSLLDMEKAKFCVKHNVKLQVSHDGVNHKLQRTEDDWIDNPKIVEAVLYLLRDHNMGDIAMTFAPMFNPNLFDSLEFFDKKLPGVKVSFRWPMRCDSSNCHLMTLFTDENIKIARDSYYKLLTLTPEDKFYNTVTPTRYRLMQFTHNLIYGIHPRSIVWNCPSRQKYEMIFDLKGNYVSCHAATKECGYGVGTIDDLKSCYRTGFTSISNRPKCRDCLFTVICQGPCGMFDDLNADIHCQSTRWAWEAWFAATWKSIFDEKPIKIEESDVSFE